MRQTKRRRVHWQSAAARRLLTIAGNPATVRQAVEIVATKFLDNVECPPTNLQAMLVRLNVKQVEIEDLPFSGELRRGQDGFTIAVSKHLSPSRRRFTIAHELGHAILETTGPRCPRFGSELERLCDMLATEILMPKKLFTSLAHQRLSISGLRELTRIFGTSLMATALRSAELMGCSAFEIDGDSVSWGYGIVRKGSLSSLDYELQSAVQTARDVDSGEANVYVWHRKWRGDCQLQWASSKGNNRTLFLLKPVLNSGSVDRTDSAG